jgi:hypothetical protein
MNRATPKKLSFINVERKKNLKQAVRQYMLLSPSLQYHTVSSLYPADARARPAKKKGQSAAFFSACWMRQTK